MPIISGGGGSSSGGLKATYRKVTSKQVLNTVTETDLLNGEITIGANLFGTSGIATINLWGDWIQNTGSTALLPTFKLKLGATTLLQWQTSTFNVATSAVRYSWSFSAIIAAANATNAQTATLSGYITSLCTAGTANQDTLLTTGEGVTTAILGANAHSMVQVNAYNSATVDTTAATALVFSTTNATATATYDVTLRGALVELV